MKKIDKDAAAKSKVLTHSDIRASRALGLRYMTGDRVFPNIAKSLKHLSVAAVAGDVTSQNLVKRFVRQTLLSSMPKP